MNAKEKAKELVNKFYEVDVISADYGGCCAIDTKHCAKITVEEILKALDFLKSDDISLRYWSQVLTEIDNI